MKKLSTQAKLAGLTLGQAIEECAARGWQSFDASWLTSRTSSYGGKTATKSGRRQIDDDARFNPGDEPSDEWT